MEMTKVKFQLLRICLTIGSFLIACDSDRLEERDNQPGLLSLSERITYHDSIGDVEIACQMLELKIDSLYDEMNSLSIKFSRQLDSTIIDAKADYKQLLQANADIYRQIYDKGTAGGSASNLYYYYQLCAYYRVVSELHESLFIHFKEIEEEGLDTLEYFRQ